MRRSGFQILEIGIRYFIRSSNTFGRGRHPEFRTLTDEPVR